MGGEFNEGQSTSLADKATTLKRPYISKDVAHKVLENEENNLFSTDSILLGVSKNEKGKYVVRFPGLKDSQTGNYLGVSYHETDDILEAKKFLVNMSQELESVANKSILDFKAGDTRIIFSKGINFNPHAAIQENSIECSPDIAKILRDEYIPDTFTNTVNTEGWKDKLFSFTESYITSDEKMQELIVTDKVRDLRHLSPKQAIDIVTNMVIDLTKYDDRYMGKLADKSMVIDLLNEGVSQKGNYNWEGNGVCRNFASIAKALFESIKSNQGRYNLLKNTYCVIKRGLRRDYDPGNADDEHNVIPVGHVWNDFIQISYDGSSTNVTTVDVTWASRDLESKRIVHLDQTLKRMEKSVQIMANKIPNNEQGVTELTKVLSYYDLMIRNPKEKALGRHHYAESVLTLLSNRNTSQFKDETWDKLVSVAWVYLSGQAERIDASELEIFYKLFQKVDHWTDEIIKKYLSENKSDNLFNNRSIQLIFTDSELQKKVNQELRKIGKFDETMKFNSRFREHLEKQNLV